MQMLTLFRSTVPDLVDHVHLYGSTIDASVSFGSSMGRGPIVDHLGLAPSTLVGQGARESTGFHAWQAMV